MSTFIKENIIMNSKRIKAFLLSLTVLVGSIGTYAFSASGESEETAKSTYDQEITVNMDGDTKEISPYIYGVNEGCALDSVTATAIRQGGNRMTGYNWETNYSNAGEDWYNSSDTYVSSSSTPGKAALDLGDKAAKCGATYKFTTLQMSGYVAADANGYVTADEVAPSSRWNQVLFRKDSDLLLEPDLTDNTVYMDEYVNYLIKNLGDSTTSTGIQGYSLDNEPALWNDTHPYLHSEEVTMDELVTKSIELSTVVKELDPNADIFGPALWGYLAYKQLGDSDTSDEWETIKASGNYDWFIDYYLDEMKKASDEAGYRLLDYLDIHYYAQATSTTEDILQGPRTLWDSTFVENSWLGEPWFAGDLPYFDHIYDAIDTYFPDTKLAISEYNFGAGDEIAGAVVEADALGVFATNEVGLATLWDTSSGALYPYSAINLYTNYDGEGSAFGDTLIDDVNVTDYTKSTAYASVHSDDDTLADVIITNKDLSSDENADITLVNSNEYKSAIVYGIVDGSSDIVVLDKPDLTNGSTMLTSGDCINTTELNVTLPSVSVVHVVLSTEENAFDDIEVTEPTEAPTYNTVEITDFNKTTNGISFTVDNPNDIEKVVINAELSSSEGSSYYGGGGGLCFTIDTDVQKDSWTWASKSFSFTKDTATVYFDGTFTVPTEDDSEEVAGTIVENEIEIQTWWAYSEKEADGSDVSIDYKSVTVYFKDNSESEETTESTEITEPTETQTEPTESESETSTEIASSTETSPVIETETATSSVADVDATLYGDVNCDNIVDVSDVVLLNKSLVQSATLSELGSANADCNLDKVLSSDDSLVILKYLVQTYSSLPVTE
jgi:hypothetical protein